MKTERSKTTKTAKCKEMQNNKKKDKRHKDTENHQICERLTDRQNN